MSLRLGLGVLAFHLFLIAGAVAVIALWPETHATRFWVAILVIVTTIASGRKWAKVWSLSRTS